MDYGVLAHMHYRLGGGVHMSADGLHDHSGGRVHLPHDVNRSPAPRHSLPHDRNDSDWGLGKAVSPILLAKQRQSHRFARGVGNFLGLFQK